MTSKRLSLGLFAVLGLAIALTAANAPWVLSGDLGDHDRGGDRGRDRDGDDEDALKSDSRVERGFQIAPVTLDLHGRKRAMVGLGSYIVNGQGACNDCHTCPSYGPGHDPYQGGDGKPNPVNYLAGGVQFGPFTSKNITPDRFNHMPAGLTLEKFIETIRTGRDPDPPHDFLQVMPWPVYRNMTDRDLRAVYEYLSSIPHAEPGFCAGPGGPSPGRR
jgi:hypothetical protein